MAEFCSRLSRHIAGSFAVYIHSVKGLRLSSGGSTEEVVLHVPLALKTSCSGVSTRVELRVSLFYKD